jgi:hypothetical protein
MAWSALQTKAAAGNGQDLGSQLRQARHGSGICFTGQDPFADKGIEGYQVRDEDRSLQEGVSPCLSAVLNH